MRIRIVVGSLIALVVASPVPATTPLTTAFTYQGQVKQDGAPANGAYDFLFLLHDAVSGGTQVGSTVTIDDISVNNGLFTVPLDFGAAAFQGDARWLEVRVRAGASTGSYTTLIPRQTLTATPYAAHSLSTATHDHFGETWIGTGIADGLRVEHTDATGYAYGVVGQSASTSGRGVYGYASAASGTTIGVQGQSASTGGSGVFGLVTATIGTASGVFGQSASTVGHGVYGAVTASSGDNDGVFGEAASTSGRGVRGLATASTGATTGVMGTATSTAGRGVLGMASASTGTTYGVYGQVASTAGRGVVGLATANSGTTFGLFGQSDSTDGRGVVGLAAATSGSTRGVIGTANSPDGTGVLGYTPSTSGSTNGVRGESASNVGRGVYGLASAASGAAHGVQGETSSTGGRGVYGYATAFTGSTAGIYGRSDSVNGYGVFGVATAGGSGTTYGVYGISYTTSGYGGKFDGYGADVVYVENLGSGRGIQVKSSDDTAIWAQTSAGLAGVDGRSALSTGRGVYGYATATTGANSGVYGRSASSDGRGVYGWAETTSGVNYGVYGRTSSASGYAGYFQGNLHTTGTLSKAAGSFKIDHPLDPENQYLYHSFVESPDMKNIYDGVVTLDANGAAVVTMPDWFEALNQDFRYQLTPIGAAMPNLHIAHRIDGNRFQVAGGEPNHEVSWQVTGIRHDPYADQNRIPVEEDKPNDEKGTFLYPRGYSQPADVGLDYRHNVDLFERLGAAPVSHRGG